MTEKKLAKCRQRLQSSTGELWAPLGRAERRHWAGVSVRGLLLDGERKSVRAMTAHLRRSGLERK